VAGEPEQGDGHARDPDQAEGEEIDAEVSMRSKTEACTQTDSQVVRINQNQALGRAQGITGVRAPRKTSVWVDEYGDHS